MQQFKLKLPRGAPINMFQLEVLTAGVELNGLKSASQR
jgi:hypothetical protein